MIFIDSNVPMYLVGASHPHKADARLLLEQLTAEGERFVTDAEVYQEILHRYMAINRRDAIEPAFDALSAVVDDVFPITGEDVQRAKTIVLSPLGLSARDALHIAVMDRCDVRRVLSFDADFDRWGALTRIHSL